MTRLVTSILEDVGFGRTGNMDERTELIRKRLKEVLGTAIPATYHEEIINKVMYDAGLTVTAPPDDPRATVPELELLAKVWQQPGEATCPRCKGGRLGVMDSRAEDDSYVYRYVCTECEFELWEWHDFVLSSIASGDFENVVEFDPPHADSGVRNG